MHVAYRRKLSISINNLETKAYLYTSSGIFLSLYNFSSSLVYSSSWVCLLLVQLLGDGLGLHKNTSTCIQLVQEYNLRMFLEWVAVQCNSKTI